MQIPYTTSDNINVTLRESVHPKGRIEVVAVPAFQPKGMKNFDRIYESFEKLGGDNPLDIKNDNYIVERFNKADAKRILHDERLNEIREQHEQNERIRDKPVWYTEEMQGNILLRKNGKLFNVTLTKEREIDTKWGTIKQLLSSDMDVGKCITPSLVIDTKAEKRERNKQVNCHQYNCPHCALENTKKLIEKGIHTINLYQKMGKNFLFLTVSANQEIDSKEVFAEMRKSMKVKPLYFLVPEDKYHFHVIIERIGTWENMKGKIQDAVHRVKRSINIKEDNISSVVLEIFTDMKAYHPDHWLYITKTFVDELKMAEFLDWNKKGDAHYTHSNGFFIPTVEEEKKIVMKLNEKLRVVEIKRKVKKTIEEIIKLEARIQEGYNLLNKLFRLSMKLHSPDLNMETIKEYIKTFNKVKKFVKDSRYIILTFWQQLNIFKMSNSYS